MISLRLIVLLLAASVARAGGGVHKQVHVLHVPPTTPSSASRALSPSLTSLSFDPAFWVEFWGNETHPNEFSMQMIKVPPPSVNEREK
jgi:hypothetical protein